LISSVEPLQPLQNGAPLDCHVRFLKRTKPARVAILCDLVEENWPSMDLVAEMLLEHLQREHHDSVTVTRICPPMQRRFTRDQSANGKRSNTDRLLNRFWDYPRVASRICSEFDLFHIIDHSYAHLAHYLPPQRTVVTCHDLDTFQSVLDSTNEQRSWPFRLMTKRILSGFQKAALVTADSDSTRQQLLSHKLVSPERVVVVHNGVHSDYTPEPDSTADQAATRLLGQRCDSSPELLHVGRAVSRKRLDVLLKVLPSLRMKFPQVRLIRVGGPFNGEQANFIAQNKLSDAIVVLPSLERPVLAAVYRRAALVLQPSEKEGFGLPVVEAMACATPVLASDIPVLREIGGEACAYAPVGDVKAWGWAVSELLDERSRSPYRWADRRVRAIGNAARFSWSEYANRMVTLYQRMLDVQTR
jgi:glycosyltransferase involved in cell wall biosynthesis